MSPRTALFILGLVLIAMPFPVLGFPQVWKNIFYILSGFALAVGVFISYIRAHAPQRPRAQRESQKKTAEDASIS